MKFTQSENRVLSEIYRRLNYFHSGNLNEKLLYLALPSDAKKIQKYGIIKPYGKEIPRALNWYNLTEKGQLFFKNYVTKSRLSESDNARLFSGDFVKKFDLTLLKKEL